MEKTKGQIVIEVWKDIEGYEGLYQVSNLGRVKSLERIDRLERKVKERMLSIRDNGTGYKFVDLHKNNKAKRFYVHRLVASTFIPNPEYKPEVNHLDGDKANNVVFNLCWSTRKENLRHAANTGLTKRGDQNKLTKIKDADVLFIRENYEAYNEDYNAEALAKKFETTENYIKGIVYGKKRKYVGVE